MTIYTHTSEPFFPRDKLWENSNKKKLEIFKDMGKNAVREPLQLFKHFNHITRCMYLSYVNYLSTYIYVSHCYSIRSNLKKMGPL